MTTPLDPCQDMFAQIFEESGEEEEAGEHHSMLGFGNKKKEPKPTPDVYALFDLTRACSEHIIKLGQSKVTSSFQASQTSNILYMQDFANVYSTLEWLKGPHMLQAFQAGQRGAEARYNEENTAVKKDLVKMVPYTEYDPGEMPSTKEELVALGLPEDDYVDVPHERNTNVQQPGKDGKFVAPDPRNPEAGGLLTTAGNEANAQGNTVATATAYHWCAGNNGEKTPITECTKPSSGSSQGYSLCQACIEGGPAALRAGKIKGVAEPFQQAKAFNCKEGPPKPCQ